MLQPSALLHLLAPADVHNVLSGRLLCSLVDGAAPELFQPRVLAPGFSAVLLVAYSHPPQQCGEEPWTPGNTGTGANCYQEQYEDATSHTNFRIRRRNVTPTSKSIKTLEWSDCDISFISHNSPF